VRSREGEMSGLVPHRVAKLLHAGPVREDPDRVRLVSRERPFEAVAQARGRGRDDRVNEGDLGLGHIELPARRGQGHERRLDVGGSRGGDPHLIGLDVDAQPREPGEVREGLAVDRERPVGRGDGDRRDPDTRLRASHRANSSPGSSEFRGPYHRWMRMDTARREFTVVPANEASWEDLRAIFGDRGYPAYCQCQKFKYRNWAEQRGTNVAQRMERLQEQTHCGFPSAATTSGLVAYLDGEPVGWCAVEPRTAFARLRRTPVTWKGRGQDPAADGVSQRVCYAAR